MSNDEIVGRTRLLDNEIKVGDYRPFSFCKFTILEFLQIVTNFLFCLFKFPLQIMKSEIMRINHELQAQKEKIKENQEKIKVNKTLPYLVSNVIEVKY